MQFKKINCKINRHLIPLKMALFVWYGAGAALQAFLAIYLRQRGITVAEISFIYILSPLAQFLGSTVSGVIADKIGRSKPVLQANILLAILLLNATFFLPNVSISTCDSNSTDCQNELTSQTITCDYFQESTKSPNCSIQFTEIPLDNSTDKARVIRLFIPSNSSSDTSSDASSDEWLFQDNIFDYPSCQFTPIDPDCDMSGEWWCEGSTAPSCGFNCTQPLFTKDNSTESCDHNRRTSVIVYYIIVAVFFFTAFSNTYRFMDVTSISMVNVYNSDFGRERLWCIFGTFTLAPLAGILVKNTTPVGGLENYSASLHLFTGLGILTMIIAVKLEVPLLQPGEKLWNKAKQMLKNPDIVTFGLSLIILGTSWAYTRLFTPLFLKQLDAPSALLGLISAAHSAYGIPFLITSNWWVAKVGSTNLVICGFLSYVIYSTSYSFLEKPWLALACEIASIFCYHLLWVAVIRYSYQIAPEGLTATIVSSAGGIHFGIGKGTGSLIGLVMSAYGARTAYRLVAYMCLASAFVYGLYSYLRKRYQEKTANNEKGPEEDGNKKEIQITDSHATEMQSIDNTEKQSNGTGIKSLNTVE